MEKSVTNPDFFLGAGSFSAPEKTPQDLINSLQTNDRAVRIFKRKGYITSDDWHLITFNNFSEKYNCPDSRDVRKTEWKEKAQENLDEVAKYLCDNGYVKELKLGFTGIEAYKCAIFDKSKFTEERMKEKLGNIFNQQEQ